MSKLNYLKSNKKRTGLIISLALITIGVIPLVIFTFYADSENPYTIKTITLRSKDGTNIQALVFTPDNPAKDNPGIVVAHGFCGNKQYMQPLSIELVKRGFTVVAIDFRGHGSSDGYLIRADSGLDEDMEVAIAYLKQDMKCEKIGLVGHSMGGSTSLRVAEDNSDKVDAVVSIGMLNLDHNFSKIHNILWAIGKYEQIFTEDYALEVLEEYTGEKNVKVDKLYGDFEGGNASKVVIGYASEHLAEVLDATIIYEAVQWFELAFNGDKADDVSLTVQYHQAFYFIAIIGVVAFSFLAVVEISNFIFKSRLESPEEDPNLSEVSTKKLIIYYTIFATIISLAFSQLAGDLFVAVLPVSMGHQLFPMLVGLAIGIMLIYYLIVIRSSEKLEPKGLFLKIKEKSVPNSQRAFIYGILTAILFIITISSISHWSSQASFTTAREVGTIIGMAILFFPFLMIKEFYFRTIQDKLQEPNKFKEYFLMTGLGILMDTALLWLVMFGTWANSDFDIAFLALSLTAMIIIIMIQQILVSWVYQYSGRNILGSTIFLCIFYSWIIISFFPFGTNII